MSQHITTNVFRENPDGVLGVSWQSKRAVAFGKMGNQWYTELDYGDKIEDKTYCPSHYQHWGGDEERLTKIHSTLVYSLVSNSNTQIPNQGIRHLMEYPGRAFINVNYGDGPYKHIISFWQYPPSQKILIDAINNVAMSVKKKFNMDVSNISDWVFDDWLGMRKNKRQKVTQVKNWYVRRRDRNNSYKLIPVLEYDETFRLIDSNMDISDITKNVSDELNIHHQISPMQKKQRTVGSNFGSRLQNRMAKDAGFDNAAQWNALRMQEQIIKENPDLALNLFSWNSYNSWTFGTVTNTENDKRVFTIKRQNNKKNITHTLMDMNRANDTTSGRLWVLSSGQVVISFWHKNSKATIKKIMMLCDTMLSKRNISHDPIEMWHVDWWYTGEDKKYVLSRIPKNENFTTLYQLVMGNTTKNLCKELNLDCKNKYIYYYLSWLRNKVASELYSIPTDDNFFSTSWLSYQIEIGMAYSETMGKEKVNYRNFNVNLDKNKVYVNLIISALKSWIDNRNKVMAQMNTQHAVSPLDKIPQRISGFGADLQAKQAKQAGFDTAAQWNASRMQENTVKEMAYITYRGAWNYVGENEKNNLEIAKQMHANNEPMEKIRLATGWFIPPKNYEWKMEVSDSDAELVINEENSIIHESTPHLHISPQNNMTLGDYLKHPLLYKYYPHLKMISTRVIVRPPKEDEEFSYNQHGFDKYRGIVESRGGILSIKAGGYSLKESLSTLMHEVQHVIQTMEGYTSMNVDAYDTIKRIFAYLKVRLNRKYRNIVMSYATDPDFQRLMAQPAQQEKIDKYKEKYGENWLYEFLELFVMNAHFEVIENRRMEYRRLLDKEEYAIYKYRFVEIEARDVANRLNLSPEERKAIEPYTSENINPVHIEQKLLESPPKDITKTDSFKQWFGNSKVIDKRGNPLLLYHGTYSAFNEPGKKWGSTWFYGTPKPQYANIFAKNYDRKTYITGANIMPIYMSLQNPLDLRPLSMITGIKDVIKFLLSRGVDVKWELLNDVNNNSGYENTVYNFVIEFRLNNAIINKIVQAGYDGIILWEESDTFKSSMETVSYIAFYPYQVKSAIGNTGNYSSQSNKMHEQVDYVVIEPGKDYYSGPTLRYDDNEAVAFFYYGGHLFVGPSEDHLSLAAKHSIRYNQFNYPGRIWEYHKVISFDYDKVPISTLTYNFVEKVWKDLYNWYQKHNWGSLMGDISEWRLDYGYIYADEPDAEKKFNWVKTKLIYVTDLKNGTIR